MYKDNLVVEATVHTYNVTEDNALNPPAKGMGNGLFELINALHPDEYALPPEKWFKDHTTEELATLLWRETDVDMARFFSTKLTDYFADGMNRLDTGVALRDRYGDTRVPLVMGSVNPLADDALAQMERQVRDHDVDGFKVYPVFFEDGQSLSMQLDDPDVGVPILEKAVELGVPHIGTHKAIPYGHSSFKYYDLEDVDEAAAMFPEITFEVVHAGMSFLEETKFLLQRYPNVWANLEVTAVLAAAQPHSFAEVLGELLVWAGPERIMWATGPTAIHPQPFIEAFWDDFQFPQSMIDNGYPPLTDDIKRDILGRNAVRFMGKDPATVEAEIRELEDDVARIRDRRSGKPEPWSSIEPTGASAPIPMPAD